ncbi:MAG: hypothetical protein GJ678_10000 [Rhodobacteraceae bacterium]|nr:hypothetical protein [Paracoccaceae bacterium]
MDGLSRDGRKPDYEAHPDAGGQVRERADQAFRRHREGSELAGRAAGFLKDLSEPSDQLLAKGWLGSVCAGEMLAVCGWLEFGWLAVLAVWLGADAASWLE